MKVQFHVFTPPPKPTLKVRIKHWFMRRSVYQWYAIKRYGTKVTITKSVSLSRKDQ